MKDHKEGRYDTPMEGEPVPVVLGHGGPGGADPLPFRPELGDELFQLPHKKKGAHIGILVDGTDALNEF